MTKHNKSKIAKGFALTGVAGMLFILVFTLLAKLGLIAIISKRINTLIFSASLFSIVTGAAVSVSVDQNNSHCYRIKSLKTSWLLIVVFALISLLVLIEAIKS